jgi:hypothetical protein
LARDRGRDQGHPGLDAEYRSRLPGVIIGNMKTKTWTLENRTLVQGAFAASFDVDVGGA